VEAVRDALGPGVRLRLDANGAWTAGQAIETIRCMERFGLEFVEQPVAAGNPQEMARVRAAVGVRIAADEDVTSPAAARRVLAAGAADCLVLKPMVLGGLRTAMEIAAMARAAGAGVIVTTTIDSGVATAATLHLAAALPEDTPACGLATGALLAADIIDPPLAPKRGCLRLPDGPGLGVDLDEAALSRYAVAKAEVS
jgi:L-alanine-DL-glutamate epimerase-like enolase superfamily enzyme